MYGRLNMIVNEIKGLGGYYTDLKVAQKMLRALPAKYETLVTLLINSNMSRMTPAALLGKINTNDMYKAKKQKLEEASPTSKKTITLKTEVEEKGKSRVEEDKSDDLDDEIALLAKRFNELLGRRGKGNDSNSYRRRGRRGSHKRSVGNLRCFECLENGHFASNCPNKEKEEDKSSNKKSGKEKLFKKLKKKGKKIEAFFGEWNSNDESSEAQSSSSDDSDEEKATKRKSMAEVTIKEAPSLFSPFCLMAKGSTKNNESKEQVAKLNKSLERRFKGKNTLDKILSEQ
ncbi:hypothetical protein E2562_017100 [Oryza meyeriana var. granulata]|uniref:CCHC-type domain-containing protein n=1 Tax=Oryza meyeriana var. granulata TaxID=110450 RepID=A0A6G1DY97_9ORYZ|nr:hypothetical protein E2562_017100 [Oryza meyeriana var. granulata]